MGVLYRLQKLRRLHKLRSITARGSHMNESSNPRMERIADLAVIATALVQAANPLYAVLNEEQVNQVWALFDVLLQKEGLSMGDAR